MSIKYQLKYGIALSLAMLLLMTQAWAQTTLKGTIIDQDSKNGVSGVSVQLKGSNQVVTSDDGGNFQLKDVKNGQLLVFKHMSYTEKQMTIADANKILRVSLKPINNLIDEVTVSVRKRVNTESALIEERRRSATVQDGISAQMIERTASVTTAQALQRVTGVTVTDEKYIAVRGMGDRSVVAQLNGARLASSNPDRSAISLDLVPAALLDNITVFKTYTPDKPADAASGIIELKTKSIPDRRVLSFEVQTGVNSTIGIGGKYTSFENSKLGFLGTKILDKQLSNEFLNLTSQYPGGLSEMQRAISNANNSPEQFDEANRINTIMQGFDQTLTTRYRNAVPDQRYSISFGDNYKTFGGKHRVGLILGGNYFRRSTDIHQGDLNQYSVYQGVVTGGRIRSPRTIPNYITPNNLYLGKYQTYKENTGNQTLNYGVLGGLAYRFNTNHELSFQYMGSWGSENNATNMNGSYDYSGLAGPVNSYTYSLKQTFRTLNTYQFSGHHKLGTQELSPKVEYSGSTSKSVHRDPDYRYASLVEYIRERGALYELNDFPMDETGVDSASRIVYTDRLYALSSGYVNGYGPKGMLQVDPNGRRWRELTEENYNYKIDFTTPANFWGTRQEFKFGGNYLYRSRNFGENQLFLPGSNFSNRKDLPLYDVRGDLDRLVSGEVIGIQALGSGQGEGSMPINGFLYNILKSPNNYRGYVEVWSAYGMADFRVNEKWRLTGGVRFESTNMGSSVDTVGIYVDPSIAQQNGISIKDSETSSLHKTSLKPYYSANLTYSLHPYMNFRLGYNTTLARPELREITNVFEYDAFQMGLVVGNPNLKNQTTENFDFRWEWFTAPGEIIAVSAFGKRIHNQLVKVFSLRTDGQAATYPEFPLIRFENEQHIGKVWGVEFEGVKNIGNIWDEAKGFSLGVNVLLAQSNIRKSDERYEASKTLDRHSPRNSPLFEQAPYSINSWLNYENSKWGSDLTVSFNMVGERLMQINMLGEPDLYIQPAPTLDFVWSQKIYKNLTFKGYAKNLINPALQTVYANPGTGGTWYGNRYVQRSYKRGVDVMIGFSYNIF